MIAKGPQRTLQTSDANVSFGLNSSTRSLLREEQRLKTATLSQKTPFLNIGTVQATKMDEEKPNSDSRQTGPAANQHEKSGRCAKSGCGHKETSEPAPQQEAASRQPETEVHPHEQMKEIRVHQESTGTPKLKRNGQPRAAWGSKTNSSTNRKCCRRCTTCRQKFRDKQLVWACFNHPGRPGCVAARHVECPLEEKVPRKLKSANTTKLSRLSRQSTEPNSDFIEPLGDSDSEEEDYVDIDNIETPAGMHLPN